MGCSQDWIELYNPNTNEVNIGGFFLTDDLSDPAKWRIPSPTLIAPRGFLLVWADNETNQNALDTYGNLHAGFSLRREGEAIGLFNATGAEQHSVTFGAANAERQPGLVSGWDHQSLFDDELDAALAEHAERAPGNHQHHGAGGQPDPGLESNSGHHLSPAIQKSARRAPMDCDRHAGASQRYHRNNHRYAAAGIDPVLSYR